MNRRIRERKAHALLRRPKLHMRRRLRPPSAHPGRSSGRTRTCWSLSRSNTYMMPCTSMTKNTLARTGLQRTRTMLLAPCSHTRTGRADPSPNSLPPTSQLPRAHIHTPRQEQAAVRTRRRRRCSPPGTGRARQATHAARSPPPRCPPCPAAHTCWAPRWRRAAQTGAQCPCLSPPETCPQTHPLRSRAEQRGERDILAADGRHNGQVECAQHIADHARDVLRGRDAVDAQQLEPPAHGQAHVAGRARADSKHQTHHMRTTRWRAGAHGSGCSSLMAMYTLTWPCSSSVASWNTSCPAPASAPSPPPHTPARTTRATVTAGVRAGRLGHHNNAALHHAQ
jgi:hypothetical protein